MYSLKNNFKQNYKIRMHDVRVTRLILKYQQLENIEKI